MATCLVIRIRLLCVRYSEEIALKKMISSTRTTSVRPRSSSSATWPGAPVRAGRLGRRRRGASGGDVGVGHGCASRTLSDAEAATSASSVTFGRGTRR